MIFFGLVLVIIGWALVVPRGMGSGSVAVRNVRMPAGSFFTTRGYQRLDDEGAIRRARSLRVVGLLLLIAGAVVLGYAG